MSIADKIEWARSQPVGRAKATLKELALRADDEGYCWPSVETLANDTGRSPSSVGRDLQLLCRLGLVTRSWRYDRFGKRTSNLFHLELTVKVTVSQVTNGQSDGRLTVNMTPTNGQGDRVISNESPGESPRERKKLSSETPLSDARDNDRLTRFRSPHSGYDPTRCFEHQDDYDGEAWQVCNSCMRARAGFNSSPAKALIDCCEDCDSRGWTRDPVDAFEPVQCDHPAINPDAPWRELIRRCGKCDDWGWVSKPIDHPDRVNPWNTRPCSHPKVLVDPRAVRT